MPPSEPMREKASAAVADRLAEIVPGSLYWSAPTAVKRDLLAPDQYLPEDFPLLGINRGSGSAIEQITQPRGYADHFVFTVTGYVRGDENTLADTKLWRLYQDTLNCLLSADTLGGLVLDLRPLGECHTDGGVLEPLALFEQDWIALMHYPIG